MSSEENEDVPSTFIDRKAIHGSGCLGSLYNQYRDQILERLDLKLKNPKKCKPNTAQCKYISDKTNGSGDLLQMIGIQDDLKLSVLLNLVPRTGISSVIDYSHPINEYTRFLHYTYIRQQENLSYNEKKAKQQIKSLIYQSDATHIITGVRWGIEFIAVLQLPDVAETAEPIDILLKKICNTLNAPKQKPLKLTLDEQNLLSGLINTKIYSSIPALTSINTICDIYANIYQLETNKTVHQPVSFTLHSIQEIYPENNRNDKTVRPIYGTHNNRIEQYFLHLFTTIKYFESSIIVNVSDLMREHLKKQLAEAYMKWLDVKTKYTDEIGRFANLVVNFRKGEIQISQIDEALDDEQHRTLETNIDGLTKDLKHLEAKERLINDLQQQHFQYYNVAQLNISATEKEIEQIVRKDQQHYRILCSTDTLRNADQAKWDELRLLVLDEHEKDTNLNLIYADFSYCTYKLSDIITLPFTAVDTKNIPSQVRKSTTVTIPSAPKDNETINILLLGESGVGKSTFINAFVNYLMFKTLSEAESKKPVVLIPVSFLITRGNNFEEHTVTFGGVDSSNNEDFDHPGQSVTQHCRSYILDLPSSDEKKLQIIDTPGFGDTRGLDQDDVNMQHTLEYIHKLSHLNAVCFLLKPNVARLNSYFRTCVTKLTDFLGPNVCQNIIFCYTNSRCTFYTPGDTGPLLKAMLKSLSMENIPFGKENTFCFDSESFRYLVARQNSVMLNNLDKQEYEKSWTTSMNQSHRLLNYISSNRPTYHIYNQWKSTTNAQLKIIRMVRPILETIKNTLRNIVLWNNDEKKKSIILRPKVINDTNILCLSCERDTTEVANFWILSDTPNEAKNRRSSCVCSSNQHISIDYTLEYETTTNPENYCKNGLSEQLSLLFNALIEFTHFLISTGRSSKGDVFLIGLLQMIDDEKKICSDHKSKNQLNLQLLEELTKFKDKYECRIRDMKPNGNIIELPVIYERINNTRHYPGIEEQMNAAEKSQENMMKTYEYKITNDSVIDNTWF